MAYVSASEFKKRRRSSSDFTETSSTGGYVSAKEFKERRKRENLINARNAVESADAAFFASQPAISESPEPEIQIETRQESRPGRDLPVVGPVLRFLDFISQSSPIRAIAEYATPDAPFIRDSQILPGTNVRRQFLEDIGEEPSTGLSRVIGQIVSPFAVPGAGLGTGTSLYRATGEAIDALAPRIARNRIAREAAREAATGAAIGAGIELSQGSGDLSKAAEQGAIGGALGAGLGATVASVSPTIRGVLDAILNRRRTSATETLALPEPRLNAVSEPTPATGETRQITLPEPDVRSESVTAADESRTNHLTDFLQRFTETVREAGERITGGRTSAFAPFRRSSPYEALRTDTKSQLTSKLTKESGTIRSRLNQAYINLVDDLHRLNQFDKYVEKVIGRPLGATERPYVQALNTRGADVVAHQILTDRLVDASGQVVGKSLKDILRQLPKGKFVDFEDYLINKHAITRAARGEKVFRDELNWTPEQGTQKVAQYEAQYPEFKRIADELYNFQREMVNRWLVDTGLISRETAEQWFRENPFYVPNKRYFSELEKTAGTRTRARRGFADQSAPVKKYSPTGSQRQIISPIESIIENVDAFVKAAKRNQVMQSLIRNIQRDPEAFADWAEIVRQPQRPADVTTLDLSDDNALEELLVRFTEDFDKSMRKVRLDRDNIIRGMIDGQPVHVKINDKQLLDALLALGPEGQHWLMDRIGQLTRVFKVLTTGANPIFALTRNIFRDIWQSYIMSKTTNNPVIFMRDLVAAFFDIARNGEFYRAFKNVGGGHSSPIAADRNLLKQSKEQILPQVGFRGILPKAFHMLENFMNVIESAPRLAEFKRVQRLGEDFQKALYEAQDLTTNFKRRGAIGKQIDQVFPYFNAAIQGLDKLVRTAKEDPAKAFVKSVLALTVPTVVLYAINRDDPNYKRLSDHIKDNFFLIPKGDGTFIRIAKPRELGTLFSDIPERLMRQFADQDPDAWKRFVEQIRTAFTVPGLEGPLKPGSLVDRALGVLEDTILGPFINLAKNEDFAGRAIVPGYLQNQPPRLQYDERTSMPARRIGELTNTSPKQLDFLFRQYGGVLGQIGIPLTAPGGNLPEALERQVTADPLYSTDVFNDFYRRKEELDQAYQEYRQTGQRPAGFNNALRLYFNRIADNLSDIRKEMRTIQNSDMPNDQKQARLRELQQRMVEMVEQALNQARGLQE